MQSHNKVTISIPVQNSPYSIDSQPFPSTTMETVKVQDQQESKQKQYNNVYNKEIKKSLLAEEPSPLNIESKGSILSTQDCCCWYGNGLNANPVDVNNCASCVNCCCSTLHCMKDGLACCCHETCCNVLPAIAQCCGHALHALSHIFKICR